MKRKILNLSRRYQAALRRHLKEGPQASFNSARGLGSQALAAGLQTLDLAKLHEHVLVTQVLPDCLPRKRAALVRQAGIFFAAAITPIEDTYPGAQEATTQLKKFVETLSQRTVELAASNLELSLEITQRKAVEKRLKDSERHYSHLLKQSDHLQEELRRLSRQILSAQEDERKKISRELHDVIAQTLTGINVRLANLKKGAAANTKDLDQNIARTQKLVEHSVNIVHRFARELRPTVLDDLGLIPALHTFMKGIRKQTGMQVSLSAFAEVEQMTGERRTVLFRVAQEALNNVEPPCAREPGGCENQEAGWRRLHDHKRQWQRLSGRRHVAFQKEQTAGIARHERAVGHGRRQIHGNSASRAKARPSSRKSPSLSGHPPHEGRCQSRVTELHFDKIMKRITVLLAEDHQIVREGFRSLLEHESDIEVVGEAENGRQAVQLTRKLHPVGGRDGHCHAIAQWAGSHPADPKGFPGNEGAHSLRTQ